MFASQFPKNIRKLPFSINLGVCYSSYADTKMHVYGVLGSVSKKSMWT